VIPEQIIFISRGITVHVRAYCVDFISGFFKFKFHSWVDSMFMIAVFGALQHGTMPTAEMGMYVTEHG